MNTKKETLFSDYPEMITHTDLRRMLNISRNSAYALLRSGKIRHIKMGKKYLIPKKCVIAYVTENLK